MPRRTQALTVVGPRIKREQRTVTAMLNLYCHNQHQAQGELCPTCRDLHAYAMQRLQRCPFQENKTTCANCRVHCYKPEQREQMRTMMRYAGPRMIWTHPLLAIQHLLDGRRREANRPTHPTQPSKRVRQP